MTYAVWFIQSDWADLMKAVASLEWVSPGAATDGVTPIFPLKIVIATK